MIFFTAGNGLPQGCALRNAKVFVTIRADLGALAIEFLLSLPRNAAHCIGQRPIIFQRNQPAKLESEQQNILITPNLF